MRPTLLNPSLRKILNQASVSTPFIYERRRSQFMADSSRKFSTNSEFPPVFFTVIRNMDEKEATEFAKKMSGKLNKSLNLEDKSTVRHFTSKDVKSEDEKEYGKFLLVCIGSNSSLRYGNLGKASSESVTPTDLLTESEPIPANSMIVVDIQEHVPFLFDIEKSKESFVLPTCYIEQVLPHEKNIQQSSITLRITLEPSLAKSIAESLRERIFNDPNMEKFYEETTLPISKPTEYIKSSSTLMNFSGLNSEQETTDSHFHPGDRTLIIITTEKKGGVTLNFCGIEEDPEKRKDCEKYIEFPPNSMIVLNFPAYTHHKFHGEFDCISEHPKEGVNIIKAVLSGTLPKGFLESATVFSKKSEDKEEWKKELPSPTNKPREEQITRS
ncbi:MAG: hypothetical protein ACI9TO_000778 [Rickettsiales bacterium]|jgi:hypothetical protein